MVQPTSRETFKRYCLQKLGAPVININVEDNQVDDRIDDAIQLFQEYHMEGTEATYYTHLLTSEDITNQYITLPSNIIGAVDIFSLGDVYGMQNMFSIRYQIALNDLYTLTSVSMVPYYMALQHLQLLEELLVGQQPLRYNKYDNILYIDMNWQQVTAGQFIIVVAYSAMSPDSNPNIWQDIWLKKYATALIKQQWGENIKKFGNMPLPGGLILNGEKIYAEATAEVDQLRDEVINTWSIPAQPMIGVLAFFGIFTLPLLEYLNVINSLIT